MRPASAALGLAALLCLGSTAPLHAYESFGVRARAVLAALPFRASTADTASTKPLPRLVPSAGADVPVVDLRDLSRPFALESKLRPYLTQPADELRLAVRDGQARIGDFGIGSDQTVDGHLLVLHGDVNVSGQLIGNLVAYDGSVVLHRGARVEGDVVALRGEVRNDGATVTGTVRTLSAVALARALERESAPLTQVERTIRNVAGVSGVFLSMLVLAWTIVFFARGNLEVASDTVRFSFPRALAVGLLGQVLAAPTFGMLIVGLILSVAGILLVPFAVIAFGLLLIVAVLGGGLAASHAMGETIVRRRLAAGVRGVPTGYRAVAVGLALPTTLWMLWAFFSWVPVAGTMMLAAAGLGTWFVWTAGFGAALLSRAGARENFAGRLIPPEALTDEYLWATPQFGVPAVKRPTSGEPAASPRNSSPTKSGSGRTE